MSKSPLRLLRQSLTASRYHHHRRPPLLPKFERGAQKQHLRHNSTITTSTTTTSSPKDTQTNQTTSTTLRHVMRKIPHPVVIVTTTPPLTPYSPRGITLSSFNCFSLSPPLISFNIATPSMAASAMSTSGAFIVHVLRSTTRAAHIASLFSKAKLPTSPWESVRDSQLREQGLLGRDEDVLYRLRCETYRRVQIEDHQFWVGKVVGVDLLVGEKEAGFGLMYAEGMFRDVGGEVGSGEVVVDDGSE